MPGSEDYAQIRTDTPSPEVAKLLIAHNLAIQAAWNAKAGQPDVDKYLATFDRIYKGIAATTAPPPPTAL